MPSADKSGPPIAKTMLVGLCFAAVFGVIGSQIYLNFVVYTPNNPTRHDVRIRDDAESGQADAQYLMGEFSTTGRQGILPDAHAARRWFEAAAAQDYAPAQYRLGQMLRHGKGGDKDLHGALRQLRRAAAKGYLPAHNALGEVAFHGEGVAQSADAALKSYRLAAEAGFAPAQRNMGFMAAGGHGMPRDFSAAMTWYRKAADQTDAVAMSNIGLMYEQGQGVDADPLRAWDCYYRATLWGATNAQRHRTRVEAALPSAWRQMGLYERAGRDCLTGESKKLTRPRSRVRE